MWRQIAAVISGIVVAYLLRAMGGYLVYLQYRYDDHSAGAVARYVVDPIVALLTGALVGVIAKRRPALLATLSLLPSFISLLAVQRRLDATHFLFMVFLVVVFLLLGAGAAWLISRTRERSTQSATIGG
jgi:hypothetical protein